MDCDVIHINVSAFPIGIERVIDHSLCERPVVIAGMNSPRAVALAVSREAYLEGVLKGMPVAQAKKFCRGLIVIPPNEPLYRRASAALLAHLGQYTPLIEPWRMGHLYLDLTGTRRLFGLAVDTAARIQNELKDRFSLRSTVGVAGNKLVSRVASRVIRPRGVVDVFPGGEATFLAPLEVEVLPGIGPQTALKLADLNIALVRELAVLRPEHLALAFGDLGYRLHRYARGIDDSPVRPPERSPSVREEETLTEDSNDDAVIEGLLYLLVERAAARLRRMNLQAASLHLNITYADHVSASGQARLPSPSSLDVTVFTAARRLLEKTWTRRTRLRYLALTLKDLCAAGPHQLRLFEEESPREEALIKALDQIRNKYGNNAIRCGRTEVQGKEKRGFRGQ